MRWSVALATFNGGKYLAAQLASVAAQTRLPDELVACDDASTDDTVGILERFRATAPFPVHVHGNPTTLGPTRNFDRAVALCTGDAIALCDQDDEWLPEKLARFDAALADWRIGLVAADLDLIDADGKPLGRRMWSEVPFTPAMRAEAEAGFGPRLWLRGNTVTGAGMAFRADLRGVLQPFPPAWDHDAWVAFATAAVTGVRFLPEPLTRYRVHPQQQIGIEPRGVGRQVRSARRRAAADLAKAAVCFDAALHRLNQFPGRLRDPELLGHVRNKAAFMRVRQRMHEGGRFGRVVPAVRELLAGNYARYGRGWKGFAADVLL
jgi:glycosyltransferase involved in cell wall biosynthesis